jgi:pantetheine-phosphate adenylyltransferase
VTLALYPGSFDPVTNGHIDVAVRAAALFDELVIGVYDAPPKNLMFTTEERVQMIKEALANVPNVRVELYTELTVRLADRLGAKIIIRGLRMGSDFEREFDMALMNKKMAPHIETLAIMASADHQFISSSLLKEAAAGGGSIENFVPEHVAAALRRKYFSPET